MMTKTFGTLMVVILMLASSIIIVGQTVAGEFELDNGSSKDGTRAGGVIPWSCTGGDAKHTGLSSYDTSNNPGRLRWKHKVGDVVGSNVVDSFGTIYFGTNDNLFFALNPDGSQKWTLERPGPIGYGGESPVVDNDGTVYFTTHPVYDVINAVYQNGSVKWEYNTEGIVGSSLMLGADNLLYCGLGTSLASFYANNGTLKWNYLTGDSVDSTPAIGSDGVIYFGCDDNKLYAIYPDKILKWFIDLGAEVQTPTIGTDGTIYVGTVDGTLYAINTDGTKKWEYKTGYQSDGALRYLSLGPGGTIYFGVNAYPDDYLYAVKSDGTLKWQIDLEGLLTSTVVGSDGTIFAGNSENSLWAITPDGTLKWEFEDASIDTRPTIGPDGVIYFGATDGNFYSVGKGINLPPTEPQNLKASAKNKKVELTWAVPIDDGGSDITGYNIFRGTDSKNTVLFNMVEATARSYSDGAVKEEVTYWYNITAINAFGESESSDLVSCMVESDPEIPLDDRLANDVELTFLSLDKLKIKLTTEMEGSYATSTRLLIDVDKNGVVSSGEVTDFEVLMAEESSTSVGEDPGISIDGKNGNITVTKYEVSGAEEKSTSTKLITINTEMSINFVNIDEKLQSHTLNMDLFGDNFTLKIMLPQGYDFSNVSGLNIQNKIFGMLTGVTKADKDIEIVFHEVRGQDVETKSSGILDTTTIILILIIIIVVIAVIMGVNYNKRKKERSILLSSHSYEAVQASLQAEQTATTQAAKQTQPTQPGQAAQAAPSAQPAKPTQPAQPSQPAGKQPQAPPAQVQQQQAQQGFQQTPAGPARFLCPKCGQPTQYMKEYKKWYCGKCIETYNVE